MTKKQLPKQISVRGEVYDAIQLKAKALGIPTGRLVAQLINNYLDRQEASGD